MHLYGKIFLWMAVVILIPAILLTTMALDIRSKWQAEVKQRQEKLKTSEQQLAEMRLTVRNLEEELQQESHLWGEVWQAPGSRSLLLNDGIPRFDFGVGQNAGLGVGPDSQSPTVFAFVEPQPGESSRFLGEFEIGDLKAARSGGRLLRNPYPGEIQTWPQQGKVHLRQTLPGSWGSAIAQLESSIIIANSKLETMKINEEIASRQIQNSEESLDQRLAELNGDGNAAAGASEEVLNGLVETLRKYDSERNSLLEKVQELRRKVVNDYLSLTQQISENRDEVEARQAGNSPEKPAVVIAQ
ncbi:hypothetical protein AB1L42_14585 [Thalassoglobus sp. JC818]|uniref:hypothetical protein n=1 Tax=Thalassoglobus sp. JC818 TaxID=3232136 RepID=UPI003458B846